MNDPDQPRIYQPRVYYLILGIIGLVLYSTVGGVATIAAWRNIDGSFPHPIPAAVFCGCFWSALALFSLCFIVAYFREKLVVEKRTTTQRGILFTRMIDAKEITSIRWSKRPIGGKAILRSSAGTSMRIYFNNFTPDQRDELINLLHRAAPLEWQEGWHEFMKPPLAIKPLPSRPLAALCALMLFVVGVSFVVTPWYGVGIPPLLLGIVSLALGAWYVWRAVTFRQVVVADSNG